jgi:Right handed beta helix region
MRFALALATLIASTAVLPATALSATLYVDDDRRCNAKAYPTVQGAVDAARAGDTIRICDGTYPEQVTVPAGKDYLKLYGVTTHGATLRAVPFGDDDPTTDECYVYLPEFFWRAYAGPWAVIVLNARNTTIRGLHIQGIPNQVPEDCIGPAGIYAALGSAYIDQTKITDVPGSAVRIGYRPPEDPHVMWRSAGQVTVDRSIIENSGFGIVKSLGGPAIVKRTRMTGVSTGVWSRGFIGGDPWEPQNCDPRWSATRPDMRLTVADNQIAALGIGVSMEGCVRSLITRNTITGALDGITTFDTQSMGGEISYNRVNARERGVTLGAWGPSGSSAIGWLVKYNTILDSSQHGLAIFDAGGHRLFYNRALGNGVDCQDDTVGSGTADTANTWYGNVGAIDSPDEICRAP